MQPNGVKSHQKVCEEKYTYYRHMGRLLPHVEMFEIFYSVGKEDPGVSLTLVGKYTSKFRPTGLNAIDKCVNVKFTVIPILWGGSNQPLRCLKKIVIQWGKKTLALLDFSRNIICYNSAQRGGKPSVGV